MGAKPGEKCAHCTAEPNRGAHVCTACGANRKVVHPEKGWKYVWAFVAIPAVAAYFQPGAALLGAVPALLMAGVTAHAIRHTQKRGTKTPEGTVVWDR